MGAIVGFVAVPAVAACIFAIAFGGDPLRWAAWGAILGMAAIVAIIPEVLREAGEIPPQVFFWAAAVRGIPAASVVLIAISVVIHQWWVSRRN